MKKNSSSIKPVVASVGAALLMGVGVSSAVAAENPFAIQALSGGYQLADKSKAGEGKCGEGKCGGEAKKAEEGKCGEGKCGEGKCGEDAKKAEEGKCGEGKCGGMTDPA